MVDAKSKLKRLKESNMKLLTNTTMHGIPRATKSDKIIVQIIWLLTFLFSAYFCASFIRLTFDDFFAFNVVTQTKVINAKDSEFPALTFCAKSDTMESLFYHVLYKEDILLENGTFEEKFNNQRDETCRRFNGATNSSFIPIRIKGTGKQNKYEILISTSLSVKEFDESIKVYVTDNHVNSFQHFTPHCVVLNKKYTIGITKQVDKKLDYPYNNCNNDDSEYRMVNCLHNCTHVKAASYYNCSISGYYHINGLDKICTPDQIDDSRKICESENVCIMECEVTTYETTLVTKESPKNFNSSQPSIFLDVFFTDLNYVEITQCPKMSLAALISAIGGQLTLFIGFNFTTAIELVEFMIDVIYILLFNKK